MVPATVCNAFADVCVRDVAASADFYRRLLGLDVIVDHGWYVELGHHERTVVAFVQQTHETVPVCAQVPPAGVLLSFEVVDASAVARRARLMGCRVVVELRTELGQRHLMVLDPDGAVVDVIERVPMSPADLRRLARFRRAGRA